MQLKRKRNSWPHVNKKSKEEKEKQKMILCSCTFGAFRENFTEICGCGVNANPRNEVTRV